MGLPGRYVGKALYYKPTREQDETSTFVFEGITQNLRQLICYMGYIFYVWLSIICATISTINFFIFRKVSADSFLVGNGLCRSLVAMTDISKFLWLLTDTSKSYDGIATFR